MTRQTRSLGVTAGAGMPAGVAAGADRRLDAIDGVDVTLACCMCGRRGVAAYARSGLLALARRVQHAGKVVTVATPAGQAPRSLRPVAFRTEVYGIVAVHRVEELDLVLTNPCDQIGAQVDPPPHEAVSPRRWPTGQEQIGA